MCIEREKVDFKSREVNCLKECALALTRVSSAITYHEFSASNIMLVCHSSGIMTILLNIYSQSFLK